MVQDLGFRAECLRSMAQAEDWESGFRVRRGPGKHVIPFPINFPLSSPYDS